MTTTPTPSQPLSAGAVPELPVVAERRTWTEIWDNPLLPLETRLAICDGAVEFNRKVGDHQRKLKHEAQATIHAQAAEIERLKRERDEALRSAQQSALNTNYNAEIALRRGAELGDLKAKQVAEADEVLRLADEMVTAKLTEQHANQFGSLAKWAEWGRKYDVAREALRAAVTKDRT